MKRPLLLAALLWAATVLATLLWRPAWPVDETRYLGVAWDMWTRGDLLLPRLNGAPYTDKPPLLFWLFHAGWAAFGVNSIWPRLVAPLFGLLCLLLTRRLSLVLWPDRADAAGLAPLLLAGALLWTVWSTFLTFDLLVCAFTLMALLSLLTALRGGGARAWLLMGLAIGLGLLAKGPVLLLHVLPAALLVPVWMRERRVAYGRVLGGVGVALAVGVLVALAWVIPAALEGGPAFRDQILFGQIRKRIAGGTRLHEEPIWFYAAALPLATFPWPFWPRVWRAISRLLRQPADDGRRLCTTWAVASLLLMSAISSKQEQYMLPVFPALALLGARALADYPGGSRRCEAMFPGFIAFVLGLAMLLAPRGMLPVEDPALQRVSPWIGGLLCAGGLWLATVALGPTPRAVGVLAASVAAVFVAGLAGALPGWAERYDTRPVAVALRGLQDEGRPTAFYGEYRAEYQFAGRLRKPVTPLDKHQLPAWVESHPDGVVVERRDLDSLTAGLTPLRSLNNDTRLWNACDLAARLSNPGPR